MENVDSQYTPDMFPAFLSFATLATPQAISAGLIAYLYSNLAT